MKNRHPGSRVLGAVILALYATMVSAADNYTISYHQVAGVTFHSKSESIYPDWAGLVVISFDQQLTWSTSGTCAGTSVAVRNEDTHIISAIQLAVATDRSVRLFADDAQKVGGSCILRAVQYQND